MNTPPPPIPGAVPPPIAPQVPPTPPTPPPAVPKTAADGADLEALQTKCRSCGGYMNYSPEAQNLKCVYCGATSEVDKTPAEVVENNFDYWKNRADESADEEQVTATEIKCRQCGATTTLPPGITAMKCAFCSTPLVMHEAMVKRFWRPEYLLPFSIPSRQCSDLFKKWLGGRWFLPTPLKKAPVATDAFRGVYLPFWTYDADTLTYYEGERGEDRSESYRDDKGEQKERTVTDWYRVTGHISQTFDDVVVPATSTLPPSIMNNLTNWDLQNCTGFRKEFLAGFVTEVYQRDFRESIDDAKSKMEDLIKEQIKNEIGGDRQKVNLMDVKYSNLHFKHLLLPVWISAFQFKGKTYRFVVNGRTGTVTGQTPVDPIKVALFILMIASVIAAFVALINWLQ